MSQKTDKYPTPTVSNTAPPTNDLQQRDVHWQLSRRNFCKWALGTAAVLSHVLLEACGPTPPQLPVCQTPDTDDKKTIAAFCEVVIPGLQNDPKKIPGAADICAVELFFDPELPAAPLVPLIVLLLDGSARALEKKPFRELSYEQQIKAVEKSEETFGDFAFAIQLVRLAYYSSESAAFSLGYPGANEGYIEHADFSFRKAVSKELTKDGNMS